MAATSEELQTVRDIGPEVAASIVGFFQEAASLQVIKKLRSAGIGDMMPHRVPMETARLQAAPLAGKTFVFTGDSFPNRPKRGQGARRIDGGRSAALSRRQQTTSSQGKPSAPR